MKRFLSLMMVVAMLFAVLAMVGCKKNPDETTTGSDTSASTTNSTPAETTTASETETTPVETTESSEDETTTTNGTVIPRPETTTTASATTPNPSSTSYTTGTTVAPFLRFDFGTNTKAEAEGKTSHEYLTSQLTYDANSIAIEYTEDTIVIYAIRDYGSSESATAFALCFDDIVTYDFDEELIAGWGGWSGAPLSQANVGKSWTGRLQYMKVRILNPTNNNMIAFTFCRPTDAGWSTRQVVSFMYLQGGAPKPGSTDDKANKTADPSNEWKTYIYDLTWCAGASRELTMGKGYKAYGQIASAALNEGKNPDHNWTNNMSAIRFYPLGAYGNASYPCNDTRSNIKRGNRVEIDYFYFGSSPEQLEGITSYAEDSSLAAAK